MTSLIYSQIQQQLKDDGFTHHSLALDSLELSQAIAKDAPLFDTELARYQAKESYRIPYINTAAIKNLLKDQCLQSAVTAGLGSDQWVMWGSNIRRGTPNAAHQWHTDLESDLWPSITLALGLEGCNKHNATWFKPASHLEQPEQRDPQQPSNFGNGKFILFDAHCQHRSDPAETSERVILFTHFQLAAEPRVPHMLDHKRDHWSSEPAPFIAGPNVQQYEERVARLPREYRVHRLMQGLKKRLRYGEFKPDQDA